MTTQEATKNVDLEDGLDLGDRKLDALNLRKPTGDDLRGRSMLLIQQWNVNECIHVASRINLDQVSKEELLAKLSPVDLMRVVEEVASFFISRAAFEAMAKIQSA